MGQPAGCRLEVKWSDKMIKMLVFRMARQSPMAEAYVLIGNEIQNRVFQPDDWKKKIF